MTQLLERAYSQVTALPESEQDAIANLILEALADEAQWTEQFANSQDALAKLAHEAMAEHKAGLTLPLDPKAHRYQCQEEVEKFDTRHQQINEEIERGIRRTSNRII